MSVSELKNKKENYTLKLTHISQNVQLLLLMFALSRTVIQQIFFHHRQHQFPHADCTY